MKARAHFQERPHAAAYIGMTSRRFCYTRQDLQQCALPCSISPDDSYYLTLRHFERNVVERPKTARCIQVLFSTAIASAKKRTHSIEVERRRQTISKSLIRSTFLSNPILFRETFHPNGKITHGLYRFP